VVAALIILVIAALNAWPRRWLVREGQKYLLRWPLLGGDGLKRAPWFLGREGSNVYLHFIRLSDGPAVHSHPWDAKALILWGRYVDWRLVDDQRWGREYRIGEVNVIPGNAMHTIELLSSFAITLCWTKPKHGRGWFFLVNGKPVNASGRGPAAYDEAHDA
jgi:hypothetical protein